MKNKIIIMTLFVLAMGCTNSRYPNWQYVRIEKQIPDAKCIYKMQEVCSLRTNACLNWHKQRATTFGADTVVITQSEALAVASTGFAGYKSSENSSTVADYYYCNGPKNIKPTE